MSQPYELAGFKPFPPERERVGLDQKVEESVALLAKFTDPSILADPSAKDDFSFD